MLGALLSKPIAQRQPGPGKTTVHTSQEGPDKTTLHKSQEDKGVKIAGGRFYELTVCNLTGHRFKLVGESKPLFRRLPAGKLLDIVSFIEPATAPASAIDKGSCVGEALAPVKARDISDAPRIALAAFDSCANTDDALEFNLAFTEPETGQAFTVRVHEHTTSSERSDAIAASHNIIVASSIYRAPRLVAKLPAGFEDSGLGIYARPERCKELHIGSVQPDQEVFVVDSAQDRRWMKITMPMEGWILCKMRDDTPLLVEDKGAPHVRQVVVVRPATTSLAAGDPNPIP